MKITIADRKSNANALAQLFGRNLSSEYISHSELQSDRAKNLSQWAANVEDVLHREIVERLREPLDHFPRERDWSGVIELNDGGLVVGLALVTLSRAAAVPFGVIEDIVVDEAHRGKGYGNAMMQWIITNLREAEIRRIFLESGRSNLKAHHLFERLGFSAVSVVMMRDL